MVKETTKVQAATGSYYPTSTKKKSKYRVRLLENPAGFIAQPTISLSTNPTAVSDGIAPRHIDLRPFILSHGDGSVDIVPGGLTRVAMGWRLFSRQLFSRWWYQRHVGGRWQSFTVCYQKSNGHADKCTPASLESNSSAHTNYYNRVQPLETGYETLDDAPMILLLYRQSPNMARSL